MLTLGIAIGLVVGALLGVLAMCALRVAEMAPKGAKPR